MVGHPVRDAHRRLAGVPAVRVHEQFRRVADDLACLRDTGEIPLDRVAPRLADLDLDARDALLLDPAAELVRQLPVVVAGEPAAAVHRYRLAHRTEQPRQPYPQQPRLQVPQRDVDGGDGGRGHPGPAQVAHRAVHRVVHRRHVERRPSTCDRREHLVDQVTGHRSAVRPAEAGLPAGPRVHDHHRGGVRGFLPGRSGFRNAACRPRIAVESYRSAAVRITASYGEAWT